jgi:hypothetical protein
LVQTDHGAKSIEYLVQPLAGEAVCEHERPVLANDSGVMLHHVESRPHVRCQIDLVDHQQVRFGDARSALARDLVALRNVDHEDEVVSQCRTEGQGQVVTARLDQDHVGVREAGSQLRDRIQVHARVVPDRGVRTRAGLHPGDTVAVENAGQGRPDVAGILAREDVVGDNQRPVADRQQPRNEGLDERGLAGANRSPDTDPGDARGAYISEEVIAENVVRVSPIVEMGVAMPIAFGHQSRFLSQLANRRSSACS